MQLSRSRAIYLVLATAVAPVLWGTTYWTTTELLPPGRPMLSATLRALPVGLLLLLATRTLPSRDTLRRLAVLGGLNIGAFFALLFVAAYRLPGGTAATLTALQPIFALGLTAWWVKTPTGRGQLAAAVTGVLGVSLVVGASPSHLDALGVLAALAAAGSMALGIVLTRRWALPVSALQSTAWQLTFGGMLCLPLLLLLEGLPGMLTEREIAGYLYLALISTGFAYVLWLRGVAALPVARVSTLALLSPVTAVIIDWAALGTALSTAQAVGVALVLLGILAAQLARPPQPRRPIVLRPHPAAS